MWKKLGVTWQTIGGILGLVTIATLIVAVIQLRQSQSASIAQDNAQSTLVVVLQDQLKVQRELATLQAGALGSGPSSTLIANQISELQSTAIALSTQEARLKETRDLIFEEDFETGFAHNFTFNVGHWNVIDDGTGNKVLEQNMGSGWTNAWFGPYPFSDGVIEYRFRVIKAEVQTQSVEFIFRLQPSPTPWTAYIINYDAAGGSIYSRYQEKDGPWQLMEAVSGGGSIQQPKGNWITIRVEAQGKNMRIFVNDNLLITASDTRLKQGRLAIGTSSSLIIQFDDFKVWKWKQ